MTESSEQERRARELEHLRAVYDSLQSPQRPRPTGRDRAKLAWGGAIGAALVFLAGKFKLLGLLAGVLKLKTLATMLLSIGVYAIEWGFPFALGFVLLILVHELGHALALKKEGIPAGAPVFIPFVGAFIAMRGHPRDAYVEARVAMAGPVLGSLGAWAVLGAGLALEQPLLAALGHTAVLINLINLVPVPPLDGGRIAGAFTRPYWVVGYAVGVVALLVTQSPLLLIVLVVGLWTLFQRWRHPVPGYDALPPGRRLAVALGYAALVAALIATLPLGASQS
ncbi:MAG: hypothetical protein AUH29_02760 [Candidatus Rokubacteria bacterium 13_1_40CM_69_27]|nr:MAG: hypothetical protein AUH29_02760 [Candidatus Rokubacteria bacterium 13_1_40CM_69_27]OLC38706.1 MAG: hypothetical protein AUH81_03505 [Candidatus Rokubacteria bacterium 13_1_40CM_4_69_5]